VCGIPPRRTSSFREFVMADIDGWLLEFVPTADGIWSLYGIDDDRPMAAWSGHHYTRALEASAIARSRVAVAEWTVNDVTTRGAGAGVVANAQATLAVAQAELAAWSAQASRLAALRE